MATTLLHVDDDQKRLMTMKARLEGLGYQVLTAEDGAKAVELFAEHEVRLAIVDYYMPGMSGDIVALEMKKQKPYIPIIIFSGALTLPERVTAFVDGFISTSDDPELLLNTISQLLTGALERAS